MRFFCVNDSVPLTTTTLLRAACEARGVEYVEVDARSFDFAPEAQLRPGDMLYRPAVSVAASRVEEFLFADGVATFYRTGDGMFWAPAAPPLQFQRAGLPIPATVYCSTASRDSIRRLVGRVGGFPLVVKVLGYSSGIGVMRVDSYPVLFSVLDFVLAQGHNPLLCAYVDQAVHWRLIVLGERVVAAYANETAADDFRTNAPENPQAYTTDVPPILARVAVRAVEVMQLEFGGVDLLQARDGNIYLLEANFPCYFAHPQQEAGIDVAGMMVEHLVAKSRRPRA